MANRGARILQIIGEARSMVDTSGENWTEVYARLDRGEAGLDDYDVVHGISLDASTPRLLHRPSSWCRYLLLGVCSPVILACVHLPLSVCSPVPISRRSARTPVSCKPPPTAASLRRPTYSGPCGLRRRACAARCERRSRESRRELSAASHTTPQAPSPSPTKPKPKPRSRSQASRPSPSPSPMQSLAQKSHAHAPPDPAHPMPPPTCPHPPQGFTPLHLAALYNHTDAAERLVHHGADLSEAKKARPPIHCYCY